MPGCLGQVHRVSALEDADTLCASQGAGEPAAGAQPQDLPCHAQWYMPPPPDKVCKPAEQPSGGDGGLGSDQNSSWTTRFQCVDSSASDSSSHGDCPERVGPAPAPRVRTAGSPLHVQDL